MTRFTAFLLVVFVLVFMLCQIGIIAYSSTFSIVSGRVLNVVSYLGNFAKGVFSFLIPDAYGVYTFSLNDSTYYATVRDPVFSGFDTRQTYKVIETTLPGNPDTISYSTVTSKWYYKNNGQTVYPTYISFIPGA